MYLYSPSNAKSKKYPFTYLSWVNLGNPSLVKAFLKNCSGKLSFDEWLRTYGTLSGCNFRYCFLCSEIRFLSSSDQCFPNLDGLISPDAILLAIVSDLLRTDTLVSFVRPLFHTYPLGWGCSLCLCSFKNLRVSNTNPQWQHFQVPYDERFVLVASFRKGELNVPFNIRVAIDFFPIYTLLQCSEQNRPEPYEPSCSFPQFSHFIIFYL